MLEKFGERCEKFIRAFMPDPFVLVLLLTLLTFGLSIWFTPAKPYELLKFWNKGFWELLSFAMQMVFIVVTGEAIAESTFIRKLIHKLASIPKSQASAIYWLSLFSIVMGWIHWGFGLVIASLCGRELTKSLYKRKISVHYPLIATASYTSMLLWHAGTTASAPLLINTPGHFLFNEIGLVPLKETIFLPLNLIVCACIAVIVPLVIIQMIPSRKIKTIDEFDVDLKSNIQKIHTIEKAKTFSEKMERSYLTNFFIGIAGLIFLIQYFHKEGWQNLNHNIVNFLFLVIGLLLHPNPLSYSKAIANSVKGTTGIILQFPFYGGIMGLMRDSGLGHDIANIFVQLANQQTLPFYSYLSSVVTKLFIPSGGGEWAVEGPVMLQAAKSLNAPYGLTTMGIAYGNMVGNMFQPFWAIPLLSIMGLKARDIMGYCLVIFFFVFPILAVALWHG